VLTAFWQVQRFGNAAFAAYIIIAECGQFVDGMLRKEIGM
jgi:hypothetical protein